MLNIPCLIELSSLNQNNLFRENLFFVIIQNLNLSLGDLILTKSNFRLNLKLWLIILNFIKYPQF